MCFHVSTMTWDISSELLADRLLYSKLEPDVVMSYLEKCVGLEKFVGKFAGKVRRKCFLVLCVEREEEIEPLDVNPLHPRVARNDAKSHYFMTVLNFCRHSVSHHFSSGTPFA